MAKEEFSHVSSSLLRQIATLGGDLTKFLPEPVQRALIAKVTKK
jgi:pantetheine-phosphate adenylyltransferase